MRDCSKWLELDKHNKPKGTIIQNNDMRYPRQPPFLFNQGIFKTHKDIMEVLDRSHMKQKQPKQETF